MYVDCVEVRKILGRVIPGVIRCVLRTCVLCVEAPFNATGRAMNTDTAHTEQRQQACTTTAT